MKRSNEPEEKDSNLDQVGLCQCGRESTLRVFVDNYLDKLKRIRETPKYRVVYVTEQMGCDNDSGSGFGCYRGCSHGQRKTVVKGTFSDIDSAQNFNKNRPKDPEVGSYYFYIYSTCWILETFDPKCMQYTADATSAEDKRKFWEK